MAQESNPFMLDIGQTDLSPVLQGIGSLVKNSRDARKKQAGIKSLMEAYNSNDADSVAKLTAENPELVPQFNQMKKFQDESTEKDYSDTIASIARTNDPQIRADILGKRINMLTDKGANSTDSQNMLRQLFEDPEGFEKSLATDFADTQSPQAYKEFVRQRSGGGVKQAELDLKRQQFAQKMSVDKRIQDRKDQELNLERLQAKQASETNQQKAAKRELEMTKLSDGIAQNKADVKAGFENSLATSDSTIAYAEKLLDHPGLDKSVGADAVFFTAPGSDAANFEALLESFDAKLFSTAIKQMVGMGSLSDAEGKKISASVGALSPKMSNDAFRSSLQGIIDEMNSARDRTIGRMSPDDRPFKETPSVNSKGWALQVDANGNQAYVSPDGQIEEVN